MTETHKLFWTGPALDDLKAIGRYISLDKPGAAKKIAGSIRSKVLRLKEHPFSGRKVPELSELGYREVIVPPYRIIYEVQKDRVVILRVRHSKKAL